MSVVRTLFTRTRMLWYCTRVYFCKRMIAGDIIILLIIIIQKIYSTHMSTLLGAQGANPETPGQAPSLGSGFFYVHYTTQHTGPTALHPIRKTKQLWFSVLLKDTSAATGQAGIRTHILTTPELEPNALDRSATTLHAYAQLQNTPNANALSLPVRPRCPQQLMHGALTAHARCPQQLMHGALTAHARCLNSPCTVP